MILTEIGEIGVHVGDDVYLLRPSLYAMSQLGEPREIVEIYATVMSEQSSRSALWEQFKEALSVIHACSEDDVTHIFGYLNSKLKYVARMVEFDHVLPLARALLTHGITGALPEEKPKGEKSEYTQEFNARDYVALATAHLGASEREAWQMTMTSLVGALRAKYPKTEDLNKPGAKSPTAEEHEATMDWFEAVERKRRGR